MTSSRRKASTVTVTSLGVDRMLKTERHQFLITEIPFPVIDGESKATGSFSDHCRLSRLRAPAAVVLIVIVTSRLRATGDLQKTRMDPDIQTDSSRINPTALLFQAM